MELPHFKYLGATAMSSIVDSLTQIYVFVADFLVANPDRARWRRSNNAQPAFTDAEVITIGLMQSVFGVATLKQTYRLIADNWRDCFPKLCSYAQFIARLHGLSGIVGHLMLSAIGHHPMPGCLYVIDSKPIPVCKSIRHGRVRLLRPEGAYFGKSSTGWYFGYKLHLLVHHSGTILYALLTPANFSDKDEEVLHTMLIWAGGGTVLCDMGYRNQALRAELEAEYGLTMIDPKQGGDKRALISSLRERIETTNSGLWNRFVDRVFSRSFAGLWSVIKLKMLHFNLCQAGGLC
jgi:IS5 family transposase